MSTKLIEGRESLDCYASGAPFQLMFCWMRPPDNTDEIRRYGSDARIASSRGVSLDDVEKWLELSGNEQYKEKYHVRGGAASVLVYPRLVLKLSKRKKCLFEDIKESPSGPSFYRKGDVKDDMIYDICDRWWKNADGTASKFGKDETLKNVTIPNDEEVYLWR